jgi:hypothetical protein
MRIAALDYKRICDAMFPVALYEENIKEHGLVTGFAAFLQNEIGACGHCSQQAAGV